MSVQKVILILIGLGMFSVFLPWLTPIVGNSISGVQFHDGFGWLVFAVFVITAIPILIDIKKERIGVPNKVVFILFMLLNIWCLIRVIMIKHDSLDSAMILNNTLNLHDAIALSFGYYMEWVLMLGSLGALFFYKNK